MQDILDLLAQSAGSPTTLQWVFTGIVSVAVALLSLGLMLGLSTAVDPMRKRLRVVVDPTPTRAPGAGTSRLMEILEPLSPLAMPKQEKERTSMRQRLKWAGFRSSNATLLYYSSKLLLVLVIPLLATAAAFLDGVSDTNTLVLYFVVAAATVNLIPSLYVDRAMKKRQRLLRHAFPDALDLLIVCVEAGLGLKSAIGRVGDELGVSHPELAAEFSIVNAEMRAGIETEQALHNLANRNGLDDIRGFAALLSQSMRFGTSVGDTLRVYASEFREKRMQRAQEAAAKLPTKMIFPMVICIFPSFFVVAIGPGYLSATKAFGG